MMLRREQHITKHPTCPKSTSDSYQIAVYRIHFAVRQVCQSYVLQHQSPVAWSRERERNIPSRQSQKSTAKKKKNKRGKPVIRKIVFFLSPSLKHILPFPHFFCQIRVQQKLGEQHTQLVSLSFSLHFTRSQSNTHTQRERERERGEYGEWKICWW